MSRKIQSVKGMNDLLPVQSGVWHLIESVFRDTAKAYAYEEIRTPVLEKTALIVKAVGEQTDIVEKEMYAFEDAGKEHVCMRPENTAAVVRAGIQHGLFHNTQTRLWYMGPMFRRDRPQKGRYRQFHQFGMEAIGWAGAEADAEVILAAARIWNKLGIKDCHLYLNSLGSDACRGQYLEALVTYFGKHYDKLDSDSQRRFKHNPLRILDSKNANTQSIVDHAPVISNYLDAEANQHFSLLCAMLSDAGVNYTIDSSIVRGLDYYTSTVFEWKTTKLGAQNTICGGGRYDNLIEQHGGQNTPACGFAMGIERLVELLIEEQGALQVEQIDGYIITMENSANTYAMLLAENLRDKGLYVAMNHGLGKLKSQLKKADASGAKFACIIGASELEQKVVQVKPLRGQGDSQDVAVDIVAEFIMQNFKFKT